MSGKMADVTDRETLDTFIKDLTSKDEDLRKKSVFKLGELKAVEAVNKLIELIKHETNSVIKRNATRALGKISSEKATNALCELLFDNDYYVKQNAAWGLGKIKDKRAVEPLLRLIKGGGGKMYSMSGSQAAGGKDKDKVDEATKTDGMRYHDVQIKAIRALGEIKDDKAIDALSAELDEEEQGNIRCIIALSLGKIGSIKAVPKLISMLNDNIWYVRRDTAIALGLLGDISAVDGLVEKLDDKYEEVIEYSAKAIEKLGKQAVAKAFLLNPKHDLIKDMVKRTFKSKQEIVESLSQVREQEENPLKRDKLEDIIRKLGG
jgi:HEAT repeat protein